MKKIVIVVLVLLLAVGMVSCASNDSVSEEVNTPEEKESASQSDQAESADTFTIGVTMKTMSDTYSNTLGEAIKVKASEYDDVELLFVDAQADVSKQLSQVEDLIAKGIDVLVLNAQDAEGSGRALDLCEEAGIPVVEVNTLTTNENYIAYVGSQDVEAGEIMGNYVMEQLGETGNVVLLEGNMGQSAQIFRREGLDNTILGDSSFNLLAELSADWQRDKAMSITEDWLGKYDDIGAILCENDDMAMGALQAVEAMGKEGIIIVGVDAIPDALQAVSEGRLTATILQDAAGQASKTVEVAYAVAKGEEVPKENMVPFQLITLDTVGEYLK